MAHLRIPEAVDNTSLCKFFQANAGIGYYLFHKNKPKVALKFLNASSGSAEKSVLFYFTRSLVHLSLYNYEEALTDIVKARDLAPRSPRLLLYNAEVLYRLGYNEKALVLFKLGLRRCPLNNAFLSGIAKCEYIIHAIINYKEMKVPTAEDNALLEDFYRRRYKKQKFERNKPKVINLRDESNHNQKVLDQLFDNDWKPYDLSHQLPMVLSTDTLNAYKHARNVFKEEFDRMHYLSKYSRIVKLPQTKGSFETRNLMQEIGLDVQKLADAWISLKLIEKLNNEDEK